MIVHKSKTLDIERDNNLKCLIQHWKGYASSEDFRKGIESSLELFKDKSLDKILSNTKDAGLVKKEDTEWLNTYAMPLLIKNGLKHIAFVLSTSVFSQMSVENFKKYSKEIVQIQYFDNLDRAKEWMARLN